MYKPDMRLEVHGDEDSSCSLLGGDTL